MSIKIVAGTPVRLCTRSKKSESGRPSPVPPPPSKFGGAEIAAANFVAGTVLDHVQLVGGNVPKAIGGEGRGAQEWNLKKNTKYLLRMQNIGASINLHEIHLDWYEHAAKDED